jgi:hypothetical protein
MMTTQDVLLACMLVVELPSAQEMPHLDLDQVEVQWHEMSNLQGQFVLGTYSFGLVKIEELGLKTVLLQPKVVMSEHNVLVFSDL